MTSQHPSLPDDSDRVLNCMIHAAQAKPAPEEAKARTIDKVARRMAELTGGVAAGDRPREVLQASSEENKSVRSEPLVHPSGPSEPSLWKESGRPFEVCRGVFPNRLFHGVKTMILRHKRLSAATAGLATLAASLALYVSLFSYSAPAYALEQTVQATQKVTSYHAKLSHSGQGMSEVWVQLNPDDTPLRARIDYLKTEDGDKVVLLSEGKAAVWFKDKKGYTIVPEEDALERVVAMRRLCDPRLAFEELQARKAAGKVKIETTEPTKEGEFLKLTVTSPEKPNQREIYEVNPTTKLAERVTYSTREGEQWKETKLIEYLDYNRPIDPKVFDPELPADVVQVNQITRPPGLVQDGESDEAMASRVAREFFEALIAQDYEKAGLIYEGIPAEKIKEGYGRLKVVKILGVGKPVLGEHPDPSAYAVTVKVELGGRRWTQEFVPLVPLTDNEAATKMAKEFFEALVHEDTAAARRALEAGVGLEGYSEKNAEKISQFFEHYKVVRIVEVGKPGAHAESKQLEVPIRVELERKDGGIREFKPYVRPVYNQRERWTICGGIPG